MATKLGCLVVVGIGSTVPFTAAAWAAGNHGSATGAFIPLGPFPGAAPAGCPTSVSVDDFALQFTSGNANPSGETIEGDAWLIDVTTDTPMDFGHATLWGNAKAFTATFHGSGASGGTIFFHVTVNPQGRGVANMSCT